MAPTASRMCAARETEEQDSEEVAVLSMWDEIMFHAVKVGVTFDGMQKEEETVAVRAAEETVAAATVAAAAEAATAAVEMVEATAAVAKEVVKVVVETVAARVRSTPQTARNSGRRRFG